MKLKELFSKKCKYCEKPVGFFSKNHKQCEKNWGEGAIEIGNKMLKFFISDRNDIDVLKKDIDSIADRIKMYGNLKVRTFYVLYNEVIQQIIEAGEWTENVSAQVSRFITHFDFDTWEMINLNMFEKRYKADMILALEKGTIPDYPGLFEDTGILLQKNEKPVTINSVVDLYEQVSHVHYRGGHAGFGIRVAKGLYFRTGAFKGGPVKTEEMKFIDNGELGITNKHLYFKSLAKSIRIPLTKIISIEPYADGFGIHTDGLRARPMVFKGVDGWYIYNVMSLIMQI